MTNITDTDIRELKDLINNRFEQLDKKLDIHIAKTDERLKAIENRMELLQTSVNKIPELAERVGELKNWRQIALIVITGVFGSVFGWVLKSGKF